MAPVIVLNSFPPYLFLSLLGIGKSLKIGSVSDLNCNLSYGKWR